MWCYRRRLRIGWTEKRTNKSILDELHTRRELLAQIIKIKMTFSGHACRKNKCNNLYCKDVHSRNDVGEKMKGASQDELHR